MTKVLLRNVQDGDINYQCLMFCCPGCAEAGDNDGLHMPPVNSAAKAPQWAWDGNLETPTLSPSILTHTQPYVDGKPIGICHLFLKAGVFQFLDDCTHSMAGQLVPMSDLPDWAVEEV